MNWLQTNVQVTENMVRHWLELYLMYPGYSNVLNTGPSFLHIQLMVLSHRKSCKGHLQWNHLKILSKIKFFLSAILIHSHGQLLSWTRLQFINQRYIIDFRCHWYIAIGENLSGSWSCTSFSSTVFTWFQSNWGGLYWVKSMDEKELYTVRELYRVRRVSGSYIVSHSEQSWKSFSI